MDNDYELLYLAQDNNDYAVKMLRCKYDKLLNIKTIIFSNKVALSKKDLFNEVEMAFYKAVDTYIDDYTFSTYVSNVIDNSLLSYIKKYNRTKNIILNTAVSYDENPNILLLLGSNKYNPERYLFDSYDYYSLREKIVKKLSWREELVFDLKEQNYSVYEIAEITDNKPRTIYNIIKRIQSKTIKLMSN